MQKKIFITGISTDVGKTIASAIVVEALEADYWKPVQAGDLQHSDTHKVQGLVSNTKTVFHPNSYALQTPMSPDAAAAIDGVCIALENIKPPQTDNHLVIEGAGGLLVPLNATHTILDLIPKDSFVIVVVPHYLGSINHTLLTVKLLQEKGFSLGILYNGPAHTASEKSILSHTGALVLGHIDTMDVLDKTHIASQAQKIKQTLQQI